VGRACKRDDRDDGRKVRGTLNLLKSFASRRRDDRDDDSTLLPLGKYEDASTWLHYASLCSLFILFPPFKREKGRRGRRVVARLRASVIFSAPILVARSARLVAPGASGFEALLVVPIKTHSRHMWTLPKNVRRLQVAASA
jgi:hypothetical protein